MERVLIRGDPARALHDCDWQPRDAAHRAPNRWWRCGAAAAVTAAFIAPAVGADRWFRITTLAVIPAAPVPGSQLFAEPVMVPITISAGGQRAPWVTTDQELRDNVEMWRRMHLADWDGTPVLLRAHGLDNMLRRYRHLLNDPAAWDAMDASDWDAVPQPIRTVAYRRMIAYWSGFYDVGAEFDLPPAIVSETLAAIVMSESWFDHRARAVNRDGTWDVGLGQASPFARQRLRELQASGLVDAALDEEEYFNPWMASRFVALWMKLMLNESNGDLEYAVRAYNRGTSDAPDRLGADYLAAVQTRLARYIRNTDAPPSWDYVWRHAGALVRSAQLADVKASVARGGQDDSKRKTHEEIRDPRH